MVLYICFFEFGIGTICFIHIFETNVDSITGFANQVVFFLVFITSLVTRRRTASDVMTENSNKLTTELTDAMTKKN